MIKVADWSLSVTGRVRRPTRFNLRDLLAMPQTLVEATLECAGNSRRSFGAPIKGELGWSNGAVGAAYWSGISVSEFIRQCGIEDSVREVVFVGRDSGKVQGEQEPIPFARSLPLQKVMQPETIVALKMNDSPLPAEHGYPARLVTPGWYAMASVKWLDKIILSDHNFRGYFQTVKYVYEVHRPWTKSTVREPVTLLKVKSLITSPEDGAQISSGSGGHVPIAGLAWSGAAKVSSIDVRANGERISHEVHLSQESRFGFCRWECEWQPRAKGAYQLTVRARDGNGRLQPVNADMNRYQYGYNAPHSVAVRVV